MEIEGKERRFLLLKVLGQTGASAGTFSRRAFNTRVCVFIFDAPTSEEGPGLRFNSTKRMEGWRDGGAEDDRCSAGAHETLMRRGKRRRGGRSG